MLNWSLYSPIAIFFLLLCGHALADFALQNEWVATNKSRHALDKYLLEDREKMLVIWPYLLTAHALHHGLMVFLVTQRPVLGLAETIVHWASDFAKCEGWYDFHVDQFVHIGSKIAWTALIATGAL